MLQLPGEVTLLENAGHQGIKGMEMEMAEEGITNFVQMAYTSQGSSSSDTEREALNKSNLEIIGYQMGLESLEARIVVHEKNEAVYEKDIAFLNYDVQVKDISIKDLKINKAGLGYDSQMNESEVVHSVFNSRESDVDDSLVNDRFKTGEGFHAVPPPYTGNYMPSRPDLSFASKDSLEKPKTVRPSAPIIEDWDTDSDNDSVFRPKTDQTKPKFTKINFVKSDENVKFVNKENTQKQVEYPRKSQIPKGAKTNNLNEKVKTARVNNVTTVGPKAVVSSAMGNGENTSSKPLHAGFRDHMEMQTNLQDQRIVDSGCSRRMTGNKSFLTDNQEVDGGFVAFAGGPKGGKITEKGKLGTGKLDCNVSPSISATRQSFTNAGDLPTDPLMLDLEDTGIISGAYDDDDVGAEDDLNNLETTMNDKKAIRWSVYLCQLLALKIHSSDKVYKGRKGLIGLYHDPRAWMSSIGDLTFFLGLHVKLKDDGIFISQDKYVADILEKSMIGSLMYLTASRPGIMFAVCACARDSPFDLEAFFDSDYAGAIFDRKSTTGGCQFLGKRLISWQCKKQTIVANSTTEAEYVAAANCCGQHIEIRHHFIRDSYEKKLIQVIKIYTDHNVADLLTKAFDVSRRKQRKDSGPTKPIPDEATNEEHVATTSCDPPQSELEKKSKEFGKDKQFKNTKGRKIADLDVDAEVTLVDETQERYDEEMLFDVQDDLQGEEVVAEKEVAEKEVRLLSMAPTTTIDELTLAHTLIEIKATKPKAVTSATTTTKTTRPKARRVVVQEPKNTSSTNEVVNTSHEVSTASSQGQASSSTYADDVMFSLFANQSNGPQLDNEDLEQIYTDGLEEMDLKWMVAMLTMRVTLLENVEHQGIRRIERIGDAQEECTVDTSTTNGLRFISLSISDSEGYEIGLESLEARIVVHEKNEAVYEEDIAFLKYDVQDKVVLVIDSQMNESERVPPPYTVNYIPSRPDLSFAGLDDSVYKTKMSETITTASKTNKDSLEKPKTIRPSAPIIEDWDIILATSISIARPVNTATPKSKVIDALPKTYSYFKAYSSARRVFNQKTAAKTNNLNEKVKTARVNNVTIAWPKQVVSAAVGNVENAIKSSAC
ncbi:hypothetical protein Tco_0702516 [Tanacetum coccineum]|uniref:Reverse transcriptase Ty1/copia-type domain-containing protein n=1 Tax=Tanacetum coccineum TaxID=301880 RepID=A0ABQ4XW67_9ASTR